MNSTWEYLVIDFCEKYKKSDTKTITKQLNDLGAQGWHLVTGFSNELYNTFEKEEFQDIAGIYSTVNQKSIYQNILIFEREIYPETKNKLHNTDNNEFVLTSIKQLQEDLKRDREIKISSNNNSSKDKPKKTSITYEELTKDPKIKEEADLYLKLYGKSVCHSYLEKKAKELGFQYSSDDSN